MVAFFKHWSTERRRLLFIVVSALTAIALSYDYMAATKSVNSFIIIFGVGILLALLIIVPILLFENKQESY
jgi:hypothetical protein